MPLFAAEPLLDSARADQFAKLQAGADKLNAEQISALIAMNSRIGGGGPRGEGGGRGGNQDPGMVFTRPTESPGLGKPMELSKPDADGFVSMFNGRDLTGWKGLPVKEKLDNPFKRQAAKPEELRKAQAAADERMRAHWKVQDGALVFDGHGDSLATARDDFGDFELFVDWKILPKGDSGIYLRGSPQVQIWDPSNDSAGNTGSGGLYNNKQHPSKPTKMADKPVGEWNTFWIKMVGDKVWVKLNGEPVVDGVVLENYWDYSKPIFPTGQIELQNHGNTLWFKNIYIKELPRK